MLGGPFLPSAFGDREARKAAVVRAAARGVAPALVEELAKQQAALPESAARQRALETLAKPGTAAVLTGQQVGLFLGPLYTIYKAATAVALAETLAIETGTPCVPIFWMATEDHDFAEIDHCNLARGADTPLRLRVSGEGRGDAREPVAETRLGSDVSAAVDAVRDALAGRPAGGEIAELLATHYRPDARFGDAFAGLLATLFADEGLLVFHPRTPGVAALAAPVYQRALLQAGEIATRLHARDAALAEAGFDSQVHVRPDASLVFALDDRGARQLVRVDDAPARAADVAGHPLAFSASALLRPIVQDALFPTAAYVGGPAEVSYFGQSSALHDLFELPVPLLCPRARFRLVDARTRERLDKLGVAPAALEQPMEALLAAVGTLRAAPVAPAELRAAILDAPLAALAELPGRIAVADRQLGRAFVRTRATLERAVDRLTARYARTLALRDEECAGALQRTRAVLFPDGAPQERVFAFPSFAADAGARAFVTGILGAVRPFDPAVQ
ncbi:MAG TPA: bacillithiol biosynthesis cysteine-adding enzyme BshC, partial [Polyangia bacterium]